MPNIQSKTVKIVFVGNTIWFTVDQVGGIQELLKGVMERRFGKGTCEVVNLSVPSQMEIQFNTQHLIGFHIYDHKQEPAEKIVELLESHMDEGEEWKCP